MVSESTEVVAKSFGKSAVAGWTSTTRLTGAP